MPQINLKMSLVYQHNCRTLRFQKQWFKEFPWLHFDASVDGILCFICGSAYRKGLAALARCKKNSFTLDGFKNLKNAREKFESHQSSKAHHIATNDLQSQKQPTITAQISSQVNGDQLVVRTAF